MFNMLKNQVLNNTFIRKAIKDASVHFATGFTAGYIGHMTGEKTARALSNSKIEPDKPKHDRKLK